jgi:hypothetical protein
MLRSLIVAACLYAAAGSPAIAFFQGPWNVNAQGTIQGYAKASSSRSCLTSDTRAVLARLGIESWLRLYRFHLSPWRDDCRDRPAVFSPLR